MVTEQWEQVAKLKRNLNLAPDLQIVPKIPEKIAIARDYFGN